MLSSTTAMCPIFWLLTSFVVHGVWSLHPGHRIPETLLTIGDASNSNETMQPLGPLKLGLTAAFFFSVLLACGLPIIAIDCLQKQADTPPHYVQPSDSSGSNPSSRIDEEDAEGVAGDHVIINNDSESVPSSLINNDQSHIAGGDAIHRYSNNTLPNSPSCQSPNAAETTELLSGRRFFPDWSRRSQQALDHTHAIRTTEFDRQKFNNFRRCSPGSLIRSSQRKRLLRLWFSRCNCFAAGIFLSSGFMELYGDVEEAIDAAKHQVGLESDFPFAPFLTLIGFFLVLSIEQIVLTCRSSHHTPIGRDHDTLSPRHSSCPSVNPISPHRYPAPSQIPAAAVQSSAHHFRFSNVTDIESRKCSTDTNSDRVIHTVPTPPSYSNHHRCDHHHHHHHFPTHERLDSFGSVLRVMLLLCAMSIHSLFEGLAVGLQLTAQHTLALFSAILLHKIIIAAGIGVNLAIAFPSSSSVLRRNHKALWHQSLATLTLASSSPIGLLVGWALMRQQQSGVLKMSTAALQGLACGTFFYVVFCELLPEEFRAGKGDRLSKLTFLILGFVLVSLYSFLMPH